MNLNLTKEEAHSTRYAMTLRLNKLQLSYPEDDVMAEKEIAVVKNILDKLDLLLGDQ